MRLNKLMRCDAERRKHALLKCRQAINQVIVGLDSKLEYWRQAWEDIDQPVIEIVAETRVEHGHASVKALFGRKPGTRGHVSFPAFSPILQPQAADGPP